MTVKQTIVDFYTEDHERLDGLFKEYQLNKNLDFSVAKKAYIGFFQGLLQHIHWEESVLFPFFEKKTGMSHGGPTEVMRQEHIEIKDWLNKIKERVHHGGPGTEEEERKLLAVLGNHNAKEEEILYPMIDQMSDPNQTKVLFEEMEQTVIEKQCQCS